MSDPVTTALLVIVAIAYLAGAFLVVAALAKVRGAWSARWRASRHPEPVDAALREEWLAGGADLACRKWREANPGRVRWFDTDNQRYSVDIDTPEDLERFAASTGHRLAWPAAYAQEAVA